MRARVDSLSPRALAALAAGAVLLFAAVAWFLVVSPKRADASSAGADLVAAELRLAEAEAALVRPSVSGTAASDVLRLSKAMPTSADHAGLILEVTRLARQTGVTLERMTPQQPVAGVGGPSAIPVSVTVNGRYHQIARFLQRARELVTVSAGTVSARGRLLSARSVMLTEAAVGGYPRLDATIELDAFVYDGPVVPEAPPEPATEEDTSTTGTAAVGSGG